MGRFREDVPQDFSASGNIAQVLRQARASLKDPSRPFTPTERRLRSTKSLFGETEFRPAKTESTRRRSCSRSSRSGRNAKVFSKKRLGSDHPAGGGSKQPVSTISDGIRRESVGSTSLAAARGGSMLAPARRFRAVDVGGHRGDPTTPSAEWNLVGCSTTLGVHATNDVAAVLADEVDHRTGRPSLSPLDAPPLPAVDLGILYVDGACARRGSTPRTIASECSSNSSSSVTSTASSSNDNGELFADNPAKERNEYEGLYGSDDDIDTSAWNFDYYPGCAAGTSESQQQEDEETSTAASKGIQQDDDNACLEFILDAIDNEVDLDSVGVSGVSTDSDSDASPDPGAAERQRERNARLAELVRMLGGSLDAARLTTPKNDDRCSYTHGAHVPTDERLRGGDKEAVVAKETRDLCSPPLLNRARDVMFKVMDRPRGPADASPSSITELPGLLAARLVIRLSLPSLLVTRSGVETHTRNHARQDVAKEGSGHLTRGCRHLFEVSKKAGADRAFFSSGTVTCLLEFIELVASEFNALSSTATATTAVQEHAGGGASGPGGEVVGGVFGLDGRGGSNNRERGSGGSGGSRSSTTRRCSTADTADFYIGSICDALTFAVGCLKNVSASEALQHRLVQSGGVNAFCNFVSSIRDLCRRCDESQRQQTPRPLSTNHTAELANAPPGVTSGDTDGETRGEISGETGDKFCGDIGVEIDDGGGDQRRGNRVDSLRRRVSPPLAHTIGLLRDLAAGEGNHDDLRAAGVVSILCSVLRPFHDQLDVVLNSARALAKLSLQEGVRGEIASDSDHVRDLLASLIEQGCQLRGNFSGLAEKDQGSSTSVVGSVGVEHRRYWEKEEKRVAACVRIAFILGNLTSLGEDNRKLIGLRFGGVESLPDLLETSSRAHLSAWECLCIPAGSTTPAGREAGMAEKTVFQSSGTLGIGGAGFGESWSRNTLRRACDGLEEMLVKTVRLLANISINRDVGQRVCCHPGLVAVEPLLGKCLEVFELFEDGVMPHVPRPKSLQGGRGAYWGEDKIAGGSVEECIPGEELLLNVVSLVANLSFYGSWANDRPPVYASSDSSLVESLASSCFGNCKTTGSASTRSRPVFLNTLFGLASKARRRSTDGEAYPPTSVNSAGGDDGQAGGGQATVGKLKEAGKGDDGMLAPGTGGSSSGVGGSSLAPSHGPGSGVGNVRREVLTGHLVKVLLHPNAEAVAEAARAFGNFSRDPSCREAMARRRADEVLVALLGHACREVVFAAAGALVNVAADPARKSLLSREGVDAGEALARLVRRAGLSDPRMAEIACQALHNLLIEPVPLGGAQEALGGVETHNKLWWTLRELVEACSSGEGGGALMGGGGGSTSPCTTSAEGAGEEGALSCVGGFAAAAAAVLRAMGNGNATSTCVGLDDELEELTSLLHWL